MSVPSVSGCEDSELKRLPRHPPNRLTEQTEVPPQLSVRVSRVSRIAALLIIALGVLTLFAGLATGLAEDTVAGIAFLVLGVVLYRLLYRFTRKVEREIREGQAG